MSAEPTDSAASPFLTESHLPLARLFAFIGTGFAFLHALGSLRILWDSVAAARTLTQTNPAPPEQLAAIIGETLVALMSHGIFALFPAGIFYVALTTLRYRQNWFRRTTRFFGCYLVILFPFGMCYGIVLLLALRRRSQESEVGFTPPASS